MVLKGISGKGVGVVSRGNIGGLGSLESSLGSNDISSLSNLRLESSSGISWSPLLWSLLTESLNIGDSGEWVMVVMVVVGDGRDATEEGDKNNGVFHFSLIIIII